MAPARAGDRIETGKPLVFRFSSEERQLPFSAAVDSPDGKKGVAETDPAFGASRGKRQSPPAGDRYASARKSASASTQISGLARTGTLRS